ncbi:aminotransferase class I/II-fold pyridoxal phosphate-dependent enzyme [Psychromonas aquimarina]|uniref:aminotransferase class I/II-fold pyridoxal phosphate-dependent enzyme n=1 Tax=Psychromonas aquimarina TaxID=444919 RepID=UPI00041ACA0B|nr:beta-eliminating lyase-related protein [Psychromonas aquimarina]
MKLPFSDSKPAFDHIILRYSLWKQFIRLLTENKTDAAASIFIELGKNERFWAYPGRLIINKLSSYLHTNSLLLAKQLAENSFAALQAKRQSSFSPFSTAVDELDKPKLNANKCVNLKPCFDVLVLHPNPDTYIDLYQSTLKTLQTERDEFYYDLVFVSNLADAVTAVMNNPNIQACLSLSGCRKNSDLDSANSLLQFVEQSQQDLCCREHLHTLEKDSALLLHQYAGGLRPELEHYYLSEAVFSELPALYFSLFNRVFYYQHPFKDLHYHIMNGVRERCNAPFYNAVQAYSKKPKGVFHALPISQASSIKNSLWLDDFYQFYGDNVFYAETSSTQGGMDSLLNPKGAIKNSQDKAAKCFGSQQTFFVTNGTSTSNKIVMQANIQPGDIVLLSSDCHKSVPYGVMLCGAHAVFLQTNAVDNLDLYGAVSLNLIKTRLLQLKQAGLLHKVKQIILTNSTFDGLIYDVEKYMMEILAIKPDIIFHWDEAWFAHAHFNPLYQKRHAMAVSHSLRARLNSAQYFEFYNSLSDKSDWPDPAKVLLRVYATQSTHKTLSCFRQGSMIHIFDEMFNQEHFLDAFYTHTSTSPNYQILASLDIARRQMNLEGFERTQNSIRLAHYIRQQIKADPGLSQLFKVLDEKDIYPNEQDRTLNNENSAASANNKAVGNYLSLLSQFNQSGFVVDPTRITVDIRGTGMDGNHFRQLLIDRYDIQVNKTSQHTVLFIVNIGVDSDTSLYLLDVLKEVGERISAARDGEQGAIIKHNKTTVKMPQLRRYHSLFSPFHSTTYDHGCLVDMRRAYYSAYDHNNISYITLDSGIMQAAKAGKTWVSASYVTPYPPGFPMLVPGQLIDYDILVYFSNLTISEIHGYHCELGLKTFSEDYLQQALNDALITNNLEAIK